MKNLSPILKNRYGYIIVHPDLGVLIGYLGDRPLYENTLVYTNIGRVIMDSNRILAAQF